MNGRLKSSVAQQPAPQASYSAAPMAQSLRDHTEAHSSPATGLQPSPPTNSRRSPARLVDSAPSTYTSPSPDLGQNFSRPESSAQAAARYASDLPHPHDNAFADLSSPVDSDAPPRPVEYTNDTFGRTSGFSAVNETRGSNPARRKTSPTERSAFGHLASSSRQPSASAHHADITQYLNQGSVRSHRQQRMDALEKQLNLSGDSSPATATTASLSNDDDVSRSRITGSLPYAPPVMQKSSQAASLGIGGGSGGGDGSDTPDRTFGRPSQDQSHSTTHSNHSRPGLVESQPSRSETTSSRDTDLPNNAAYGVGEAGSAHQLEAVTRTLSPEQRRQQQELDRMAQQREMATPITNNTDLASQRGLASPASTRAAQRASHHSTATVTATSASLTSSSTPKQDARLSRQTQASTLTTQPHAPPSGSDHHSAFDHRLLFEGEVAGAGSQDSVNMLSDQASPSFHQGPPPARSASVRVKTPMFGNTLAELPPDQRESMVGAFADVPDMSPESTHAVHPHNSSEPGLYRSHQAQTGHVQDQMYPFGHQSQIAAQHYQEACRTRKPFSPMHTGEFRIMDRLDRTSKMARELHTCPTWAICTPQHPLFLLLRTQATLHFVYRRAWRDSTTPSCRCSPTLTFP